MAQHPVLRCDDRNGAGADISGTDDGHPAALEAYAAFAERREPSFTGRWAVSRSEHNNA